MGTHSQIIKYKWLPLGGKMQPFFFLKDGDSISRMKVLGEDLSMKLGQRKCTGHFSSGRHVDCPGDRIVETSWNCNECRLSDDFFMCMKCDGSECINAKQRPSCEVTKYYVYLAAFDSVVKVGISNERRLMERLIEQGADFAAKIAVITDGKEVRLIEQQISKELSITDRLGGDQKHMLLFGNPNNSMPELSKNIRMLQNNGLSKYMIPPEIYDLRGHYGLANVPSQPTKLRPAAGKTIKGRAVAAKGNIIVLEEGGAFSAVNAHDLIGYTMSGPQLSLMNFAA